ncbi:MAG TPA: glycosyltransferase, partial [Candidatus Eisenbacteria bacterium]
GIQRTLAFSRDLREFGWHPIVLSANPRAYPGSGPDQLSDIPADVPVYRPFALDASRHLSILGRYPKALSLPDRWSSWALGAAPAGWGIIRRHRPDAIWSTYPISTAHLIGLWLHRMSGLPWIADFRDSMTEAHFPPDATVRRVRQDLERKTVEQAARAVFTTPGACRMYAERYPGLPADRWAVIPNGYDEGPFRDAERSEPAPRAGGGPTVLVHSGLLYPLERDPRPFFDALGALRRRGVIAPETLQIVLRASGFDDQYRPMLRERGIEDIVRLDPPLGYRAALAELLAADGLLLFQAASCNHQIPAKLYEYLRAGRPIFAMTDSRGDTARVLLDAGVDSVAPRDSADRIAEGLTRFLDAARRGAAPVPGPEVVERYSRRARARELAALLDTVAGG